MEENRLYRRIEDIYLSQTKEKEFDSLLKSLRRKQVLRCATLWTTGLAAAVALFLLVSKPQKAKEAELTPLQIAESISSIMKLGLGDIESISAKPMGNKALLTAYLKDGSTCYYIMTLDQKDQTITLTALLDNR